jgi:RND family efflux transporter MFP subunit
MSRRLSWILPLLALLAAAGWFAWRLYAPPEVSIVQPSRGVAIDAVYATGLVEPTLEIRIAPRTPGRIVELLVDEGATVRAGQLLARLEDSDLQSSVAELEARATYAQSQFDRNSELRRSSLISQDALERSRSDLDAARAALRRSRATVAQMRLTAPAAGRIIRRDGEVGEYVAVNTPVFYLAASSTLRITADVDEEDLPRVAIGQRVLIRSDAFPDSVFEGRVRGDHAAWRSGRSLVSRAHQLRRRRAAASRHVHRDQYRHRRAAECAARAGQRSHRHFHVWRVNGDRAERRPVKIGVRSPERIEILSGVSDSDQLIDPPPESLQDGSRIRIQPTTP